MTTGRDDDALSWDGDDDPTLDAGDPTERGPLRPLPVGFTAAGKGADALTAPQDGVESVGDAAPTPVPTREDEPAPAAMGNVALVSMGVLGGIYLLFSVGWLLGAARLQLVAGLFLEPVAFQAAIWLAALALPLWFLTVLVLTRGGRAWMRFVFLAAGAVILLPWPFVLAGAAA